MFKEYAEYDAVGLAELVQSGEVSAEELLEAAICAIDTKNESINSVVSKTYDYARSMIGQGLPSGPLTGVPFFVEGYWTNMCWN